jgi:hypothetical protein
MRDEGTGFHLHYNRVMKCECIWPREARTRQEPTSPQPTPQSQRPGACGSQKFESACISESLQLSIDGPSVAPIINDKCVARCSYAQKPLPLLALLSCNAHSLAGCDGKSVWKKEQPRRDLPAAGQTHQILASRSQTAYNRQVLLHGLWSLTLHVCALTRTAMTRVTRVETRVAVVQGLVLLASTVLASNNYTAHSGRNCFNGHGGVNIDGQGGTGKCCPMQMQLHVPCTLRQSHAPATLLGRSEWPTCACETNLRSVAHD